MPTDLNAKPPLPHLAFYKSSKMMDFLTIVEAGMRPPIAFKSGELLHEWLESHSMHWTKLGKRDENKVMLIKGAIEGDREKWPYEQIWARADYDYYRSAVKYNLAALHGKGIDVDKEDVDHAVSKKYLKQHWPESWVNILFVKNGLNRAVGPMMEKSLLEPKGSSINFNIECMLKLLFKKGEKSLSGKEIEQYFAAASRRFVLKADEPKFQAYADRAKALLAEIWAEHLDRWGGA